MFRTIASFALLSSSFALHAQIDAVCNPYDNNLDGHVGVQDILGILGVYGNSDVDFDGIWDDVDDCILDACDICNGPGPQFHVLDSIFPLYDSIYIEQLSEWYVFQIGTDTSFSWQCEPNPPSLEMISIAEVSSNSAQLSAEVIHNGSDSLVSLGFQISSNSNFNNPVTFEASQNADNPSIIEATASGLNSEALLHVRAFASNSVHTGYSESLSFETLPAPIVVNAGSDQIGIQGTTTNLNNNSCNSWLRAPLSGNSPPAGWSPSWTVVSGNHGCFSGPNSTSPWFYGRQGINYTIRYTLTHQETGIQYWDDMQLRFADYVLVSITRVGGTNNSTIYQYFRTDGYNSDFQYISNGQAHVVCAWAGNITFPNGGSGLEIVNVGSCN